MSWKLCVDFKRATLEIPAKKLEEQSTAKLQGCQEKPEVRKSETLFDETKFMDEKNDTWGDENVFLFEFRLLVPAVLKYLF